MNLNEQIQTRRQNNTTNWYWNSEKHIELKSKTKHCGLELHN